MHAGARLIASARTWRGNCRISRNVGPAAPFQGSFASPAWQSADAAYQSKSCVLIPRHRECPLGEQFHLSQRRMAEMLRRQLLDTSRGRIVTLLQGGGLTADDIATKLRLTRSAVRVHITAMERDGVVGRAGKRPGTTRPSHVFELTFEVDKLLSKAYIPVLTHLVDVFAASLPAEQVETLLRLTGKALANELPQGKTPAGGLQSRVAAAS
jgi:DNA-binding MarR family transcriptional regulator